MKTFFDITKIGRKEVRNRFFVAPMSRVSADLDGIPTSNMHQYYKKFAEGGFGAIITEGVYTDQYYSKAYPNQPGIINNGQIQSWKKITDRIHLHSTLVIAQLMHAGALSQVLQLTKAPSKIIPLGQKLPDYGGGSGSFPIPEEMREEDIYKVVNGFVDSAQNASEAGFDGIELHAANGYLLDQFITPYLNLRTDKYGGSIENRLRIIQEITCEIKNRVPADFIVGLRISEGKVNNLSYRWEGGSKTARIILNEIKKLPIDYLHIAAEHSGWEVECVYNDGTTLTGLAKEILDCLIIANGRLHDLELAQKLLENNQTDFFAIGKYAISNPDFVRKVIAKTPFSPFDIRSLSPNPSLFSGRLQEEYLPE